MKPGFPLKLAFAIVFLYVFVTLLFLDGKTRDDAASPPRFAAKAPRLAAPERPFPAN